MYLTNKKTVKASRNTKAMFASKGAWQSFRPLKTPRAWVERAISVCFMPPTLSILPGVQDYVRTPEVVRWCLDHWSVNLRWTPLLL